MTARWLRVLVLAFVVALLASCAPIAKWTAGAIENGDAELVWGTGSITYIPDQPSRDLVLTLDAPTLTLTEIPDGMTCVVTTTTADCRMPAFDGPVVLGLTGTSVLAFATYRLKGAQLYRVFAPFGE